MILHQSDDFAFKSGPMMNPKMIDRLFGPSYKRIIRAVHDRGGKFILHSCGDNTLLIDTFIKWRADGLHAYENTSNIDIYKEAFTEQAEAIAAAGADAIAVETMMDITEALAAIAAAKKTGLPVVATMVFDSGRDKDRTMMGNPPEEVAEKFAAAGVDVIGSNCGKGIERFIPICKRMRAVTDRPLWMKANAGECRNESKAKPCKPSPRISLPLLFLI